MKPSQLIRRYDTAMDKAAKPFQRAAEALARELCETLTKHIGPVTLTQGMGTWTLDGPNTIPVIYSDESRGEQTVSDFASRHADSTDSKRCCETPQVPVEALRALRELAELCEWVNDPETRGVAPFDLSVPA